MSTDAPVQIESPVHAHGANPPSEAAREPSQSSLSGLRRWFRWPQAPRERGHFSFRASMVFHALAMIALALWSQPDKRPSSGLDLITGWQPQGELDDAVGAASAEIVSPFSEATHAESPVPAATDEASNTSISLPQIDLTPAVERLLPRATANDALASGTSTARLPILAGVPRGGGLEGRGQRGKLAFERGATTESEAAVERGLNWLLAHQFRDGSWHFDHTLDGGPCNGYCRQPGTNGSSTGATAMALLAFYGAGYTHKKGP
jgi:hypothetical protein